MIHPSNLIVIDMTCLINCDMGEMHPDIDTRLMPNIDMASIACGGHCGDDKSMQRTVQLAKTHQVTIGAHPSYVDAKNFGRVSLTINDDQLFKQLTHQVARLSQICTQHATPLKYLKPHGALYHDMTHRTNIFITILKLLARNHIRTLVVPLNLPPPRIAQADKYGVQLLFEAFADRRYRGNEMVPRSEPNSMITTPQQINKQLQYWQQQTDIHVDTVCFHSDNPASVIALTQ